jgi:HlyD family secretion protein
MSKLKHFVAFITAHRLAAGVAAAVLLIGGSLAAFGGGAAAETAEVRQADLVRTVRISGKVAPREKAELGFEIGGTVASVEKEAGEKVAKGQVLVSLSSGTIAANLQKAQAELASARAEYAKLEGTAAYENSVTSAEKSVLQAMKDAYTAASDAIENKADQVFVNPLSSSPEIKGSFDELVALRDPIVKGRVSIGYTLSDWRKLVDSLGTSYTASELQLSKTYLAKTSDFISLLSRAVNMFEETAYMSQATIDGYKAGILAARQSLNAATQSFIDAEKGLSSTLGDVPVQLARVEAAEASVANLRYELGKTSLVSPISGVVARQDAKAGQAVSAGASLVSVISPDYIIEAYIPEVSIAGVKVGDGAEVTLDAYGPETAFAAKVEYIDPAETLKDGVSTYKVRLAFDAPDERVRSGLTANVSIETLRKPAVTLVPERAIVREGGKAYATLLAGKVEERTEVVLGDRDSQGGIEVLSGLSAGDRVLINPEK